MNVKRIISKVIKNNIPVIILSVVCLFIMFFMCYLIPTTIKDIVDQGITSGTLEEGKGWILFLFSVYGVIGFFGILVCINTLQFRIDAEIKKETYTSILKSDYIDLDKLTLDEAYSKIDNCSRHISKDFITDGILRLCLIILFMAEVIIVTFVIYPVFAIVEFAFCSSFVLLDYIFKHKASKIKYKMSIYNKENNEYLNNVSKNIKEIKITNAVEYQEKNYNSILLNSYNGENKLANLTSFEGIFMIYFYIIFTVVLALVMGINNETVTIGSCAAVISLVPLMYISLLNITKCRPIDKQYKSYFRDLNSILNIRSENRVITINELPSIDEIIFENVTFEYWDTHFVIDNLNFSLDKGDSLGIVGKESDGKTSIIYLLSKLIRPKMGKVLINGEDINRIDTYVLRNNYVSCSKDYSIGKDTFKNIIIGLLPFDEYRFNETIHKCFLNDVIAKLPIGVDTIIFDESPYLTLEDKEKIQIAKAFYKDSDVLMFDDCFDHIKKEQLQLMLDMLMKNKKKICVYISNNPIVLSRCTKLLMLKDGKSIEYGETANIFKKETSKIVKFIKEREKEKKGTK